MGIFGEWLRRNQYGVFLEWNEEDGEWALVPLEADGSPKVPGWAALLEYLIVQAGGTREHACVDDRDSPRRVAVQAGARSYCARAAVCRPSAIRHRGQRAAGLSTVTARSTSPVFAARSRAMFSRTRRRSTALGRTHVRR